jgi:UDP-N-acetylmuramate--alanine ligase
VSARRDARAAGGGETAADRGGVSADAQPWAGRAIHFVGVGGAGMSGYARAAAALGASVSGSDSVQTPYLAQLASDGVLDATIGYDAGNLPPDEAVELVYGSAVPAENPERAAARERGLSERPRADLLAELTALRRTIAVAGAHGKTTTAAMVVHALRAGGLDPGWMIGGTIGGGLRNAHWSEGNDWLVVEADESDRSMLSLNVEIAVLTSAELDHHAAYGSLSELLDAYAAFLSGAPRAVIWDRPQLLSLREGERVSYDASEVELRPGGSRFDWRGHEVSLAVPGAHNAINAAAALEVARLLGVEERAAIAGVEGFAGAGRRFERLGRTRSGALVVDDYAHHPTEVAATIAAARAELDGDGRLIAVFQPHLYSRTALLASEFGRALAQADATVVLDVYPARERQQDHEGVSGLLIARAAAEHARGRPVMWLPRFEQALPVLRDLLQERDLCLAMGAGDIDALARGLVER